jgi:two-component system chemotaxis response regulator CheY
MIVDDSASLRQVVNIALREAGYEVLEACDGVDALGKLDGRRLNLMISDVNMPNMDGISLVQRVKSMQAYQYLPIIMLTTESQEDAKRRGKEAGVKAWVVKPFNPEQMLNAVSRLVTV